METKELDNGWTVKKVRNGAGLVMHASATRGDYRVIRDGVESYSAYRVDPYSPIGVFPMAGDAMNACDEQRKLDEAQR